jgi:hypothetical protein
VWRQGLGHIVGPQDMFGSGGGLWDVLASHLGSRVLLLVTKACLEVREGSGICQPRVWDRGTSWVSLVVTEMC